MAVAIKNLIACASLGTTTFAMRAKALISIGEKPTLIGRNLSEVAVFGNNKDLAIKDTDGDVQFIDTVKVDSYISKRIGVLARVNKDTASKDVEIFGTKFHFVNKFDEVTKSLFSQTWSIDWSTLTITVAPYITSNNYYVSGDKIDSIFDFPITMVGKTIIGYKVVRNDVAAVNNSIAVTASNGIVSSAAFGSFEYEYMFNFEDHSVSILMNERDLNKIMVRTYKSNRVLNLEDGYVPEFKERSNKVCAMFIAEAVEDGLIEGEQYAQYVNEAAIDKLVDSIFGNNK